MNITINIVAGKTDYNVLHEISQSNHFFRHAWIVPVAISYLGYCSILFTLINLVQYWSITVYHILNWFVLGQETCWNLKLFRNSLLSQRSMMLDSNISLLKNKIRLYYSWSFKVENFSSLYQVVKFLFPHI